MYILCFDTIISLSLDTCYLFYCNCSIPTGILFYYMTELVIINFYVEVCDGSRGTQVGRKSFNMLK